MEIGKIVGGAILITGVIAIISLIVAPGSAAASVVTATLNGYSGVISAAKK